MFDLRLWAPANPAESQLAEGGANAADNCIPAAMAYVASLLGYPDVNPEQWTEDEYHTEAPGATTLEAAVEEAGRLFPGFPSVIQSAPDLDFLDVAGGAGRLSIILATVDCPTVRYGPGVCGHAGIAVAKVTGGWLIWNPWSGREDFVADATFAAAIYWQGTIERDVRGGGMATIDDVYTLLNQINTTTLGRMEQKIDEATTLLNQINTTTLGRMEQELKDLQAAVAKLPISSPAPGPAPAPSSAKITGGSIIFGP